MSARGPVCHRSLRRFWIEFDAAETDAARAGTQATPPAVGVTAESLPAALELVRQSFARDGELPEARRVVEDVDVSTLDPTRVLERAGPSALRGVWFPLRR